MFRWQWVGSEDGYCRKCLGDNKFCNPLGMQKGCLFVHPVFEILESRIGTCTRDHNFRAQFM